MTKPYTRRSSSEWQQIINDQAKSGLSAPQYCQQHGVGYASFSKWRPHFSGTKASPASSHSDFIDLSQVPTLSGSGRWNITLCLGDGIELRLSHDGCLCPIPTRRFGCIPSPLICASLIVVC